MTLLRVVNWGNSTTGDVFVRVTGDEGRDYRLEMPRDVALQLMVALRRAVSELPEPAAAPERTLIEVARCVEVAATGRRLGVVLETSEGLELPLALDEAAVESLAICIRGGLAPAAH